MIAVFKRELASYWKSMTGYLITAFLLVFVGIYCMAYNLSGYYANFEYAISGVSFIYLIAVPILSMRTIAEERHTGTYQLLYCLPIRLSDVVIGKYLGMLAVLAVPCLVMAAYPPVLSQFGNVPLFSAYGTLLAFFLLGATLLSVGLFVSSVTESQVASAVITLLVMLLLYFMTSLSSFVSSDASASLAALMILAAIFAGVCYIMAKNWLISVLVLIISWGSLNTVYLTNASLFSGLFGRMMNAVSVFERFNTFVDGVFDLTAIVYDLSIISVFLFLTVQAMEKRRWSE